MKLFKSTSEIEKRYTIVISVLLHGLILSVLIFINSKYTSGPVPEYTLVNFIQPPQVKTRPDVKRETILRREEKPEELHKEPPKIAKQEEDKNVFTEIDTAGVQQVYEAPRVTYTDTTHPYLKFAKTLLDTFLVLHPEYSKYILAQQARNLINDKTNKENIKLAMEKKINDMLHKYIRQQFLGNAGNAALDKYPGPGVGAHVPLDGLIDAVRKLFEGNMPPDTSGIP